MKLTFLGTGSAFTVKENFQSNMLLEDDNGNRFLIDCGSDARHSLYKLGLQYSDIHDVYISHTHADHAGGLEWLGFTHKFDPSCSKPNLYISEFLVDKLWDNTLSGGMRSIKEHPCTLETYFNVHGIKNDVNTFTWNNITFNLIKVIHIYDHEDLVPCYGVFFELNGKKIYITADTTFTPDRLMPIYEKADIIFHDCETADYRSGVHSHFEDLKTLPDAIKQKMWLYHYNPGSLPDGNSAGFQGFVKPAQVFNLNNPDTYK